MTREEAIKILKAIRVYECYPKSASEETKEAIDMAIEALKDRPHGEWIEMGENEDTTHNIKCNQCGQGYQTRGHAHSLNTREKYKFCPNCGAKMGGDTE